MYKMSNSERLRFLDALNRQVTKGDVEIVARGPRAQKFADTIIASPPSEILYTEAVDQTTGKHLFQLGFDELGDSEAVLG